MNPTHFLDIMIREPLISRELHARLLTAVHFRIMAGDPLGVTWPDWREERGDFGMLLRVFGEAAALASYINAIDPLQAAGLVRLFQILPVPQSNGTVLFCRNRTVDKFAPSRAARRLRRAAARGETPAPTGESRPDKVPHFLKMKSETTSQVFAMYISRKDTSEPVSGGNQYGLGYGLPDF